jgi:succinate dehydrogenase / fumarate reductase cytochrome b subunit
MSEAKSASRRPLSPFMIGPYYKPQLTSMLSITHRILGVAMAVGSFLLAWWFYAVAAGPDSYAVFFDCANTLLGRLVLAAFVFAAIYHTLNGIRHLLWDIGWFLEIRQVYATGYVMAALAALGTLLTWYCAFMRGGA